MLSLTLIILCPWFKTDELLRIFEKLGDPKVNIAASLTLLALQKKTESPKKTLFIHLYQNS